MTKQLRLHVISAASEPGGSAPNEDRYGVNTDTGYAWVLDAATSTAPPRISQGQTDGAWFADRVDKTLRTLAASGEGLTPVEMLERAALDTRNDLIAMGLDPNDRPPYGSIVVVSVVGDELRYAILGDVVLAIQPPGDGPTTIVRDTRGDAFVKMAIDLSYRYSGKDLRTHQRAFEARFVNTPEGYPILSTKAEPPAALGGQTAITGGTAILLASDGLSRLVEVIGQPPDYAGLIRRLGGDSRPVHAVISELREIESADADRLAQPRIKRHDDATGVLLSIR
jgi:hypothetical protein